MTDDDDPGDRGSSLPQDVDRMSLGSLQRELARQKAHTALKREATKDRIADGMKPKTPWKKILGFVAAGFVVIGIGLFIARESLPAMSDWSLPAFIAPERRDPDPVVAEEPAPPPDAGPPDAGRARWTGMRTTMTTTDMDGLDLGMTMGDEPFDPLEGIDDDL